jgi:hypothetical protein
MKNFVLIFGLLSILFSCEKTEKENKFDGFCNVTPDDWKCEIIEDNFEENYIPKNTISPLAIVTYECPLEEIIKISGLGSTMPPVFILDIYPIEMKDDLIDFINSQQLYSWCIPMLYGETEDYLLLTSPCFINYGNLTDEGKSKIKELHTSLQETLMESYYNQE